MIGKNLRSSRKRIATLQRQLARFFLIASGITMLIPSAWMVVTSLKDEHTLRNHPTEWTISLPVKREGGTIRLDSLFFVTEEFEEIPLVYFTQLLACALGVESEACRFDLNYGDIQAVLEHKNCVVGGAK